MSPGRIVSIDRCRARTLSGVFSLPLTVKPKMKFLSIKIVNNDDCCAYYYFFYRLWIDSVSQLSFH